MLGFGGIGRLVARHLTSLGMAVSAVRRSPWTDALNDNDDSHGDGLADERLSGRGTLDQTCELARGADVLLVALPLNRETAGVVDSKVLAALAPGAVVVNVGRGALVEHGAMLAAVESGHVSGFASDVGVGHPVRNVYPMCVPNVWFVLRLCRDTADHGALALPFRRCASLSQSLSDGLIPLP